MQREKYNILEWPSQSPDLNIMENLWNEAVRAQHPSNLTELERFCMDKWSKTPPSRIQKLIKGYRRAGLTAVGNWLEKLPEYTDKEKLFFLSLLRIVLHDSYFCLVIISINNYRYIDDILIFWEGPVETLMEIHHILNSVVPILKFTLCHEMERLNFLDITIQKQTDLYKKDTDRSNMLHNTSFHTRVLLKSLPMTQCKRVKRIVFNEQQCEVRLKEMSEQFLELGYPQDKLIENLTAIQNITPTQFRTPQFIGGFSHVKEFSAPPLNLKDLLVRADIGPQKKLKHQFLGTPQKGTFPCLSCAHCNNITKGNSFTHMGKNIPIKKYYTCKSRYLVYLIKCPCGLAYVVETTQKVKERFKQHKCNIHYKLLHLLIPANFYEKKHTVSQL
ncbi:hypothetical protein XELAEV_18024774mg [Xenopus laevis]|uniref:Helix-turn-helix domain-containing protein n=1 Tax=Xenopus laevis TaxID=8355 RepID=A0A974D102_XENLA|nr:hypothetical protein XELAEV_18024774mg [Xenopus laevis]